MFKQPLTCVLFSGICCSIALGQTTPAAAPVSSLPVDETPAITPADSPPASGTSDADKLAQQLANPIASLISVPFQYNFDTGSGPDGKGQRSTLNIQPVIPISLGDSWTLITRTILPVIYQDGDSTALSNDSKFGLGDTTASFFLSPNTDSKFTFGFGPVVYLPTATEDELGVDRWGLGPTAVALYVDGPITTGVLANHIWSIGKTRDYDSYHVDRPQINSTFIQPFLAYGIGGGWTATVAAEASYNWESNQWTIPVGLYASKVFKVGDQMMSLQAGPRYYAITPDNGPEWGFRVCLTLIFP